MKGGKGNEGRREEMREGGREGGREGEREREARSSCNKGQHDMSTY